MRDDLVVDFDHHSAGFGSDPFGECARLRAINPVVWTWAHGVYWVVTGHEEVAEAFRDYEVFSSASGATIPDLSLGTNHLPITVDPPEHSSYRRILVPLLSRSALAYIEPEIRATVGALLDDFKERGSWEFVEDFAAIVPSLVTLRLLGFPEEKRNQFRDAMRRSIDQGGSTTAEDVAEEREWMIAEIRAGIEARRAAPTDDLLSLLVHEPFEDRRLADEELINLYFTLFIGGFHTTIAAVSSAVVHLQQEPADRAALIADPTLIPEAIEELIRCYPPAMGMARTVTTETKLGGVTMRAGDKVLLSIAGANHDPSVFTDPDRVDFSRGPRTSMAWGWGVHRCVGIHLARIMLAVELGMLLDLIPGFVVDEGGVVRSESLGFSYHFDRIPATVE